MLTRSPSRRAKGARRARAPGPTAASGRAPRRPARRAAQQRADSPAPSEPRAQPAAAGAATSPRAAQRSRRAVTLSRRAQRSAPPPTRDGPRRRRGARRRPGGATAAHGYSRRHGRDPPPLPAPARVERCAGRSASCFALAIVAGALRASSSPTRATCPRSPRSRTSSRTSSPQVYAADGVACSATSRSRSAWSSASRTSRPCCATRSWRWRTRTSGSTSASTSGASRARPSPTCAPAARSQGFSTLTMQLSRVLFLTPEKTYERKVKEIILAFQIEKNFTKEEIFTLYCNQVYFGHGNYGVEATSQFLFGKSIKDLTLAEAALDRRPAAEPLAPLARRAARAGAAAPQPRAASGCWRRSTSRRRRPQRAKAAAAGAAPAARTRRRSRPYFLEEVRKYLEREYGSQRIYQGGLRVYTTLDPAMQQGAPTRACAGPARASTARRAASCKPDGVDPARTASSPSAVHLDEWDRPDRARTTSCAAWCWPRTARSPSCRSASTGRALSRARHRLDAARRTSPTRCRRAPSRRSAIVVAHGRRRPQGRAGRARAGAEARGRAPRHRRRARARSRPWWAATTSSAASSTAPPRPSARSARPSSRSSTRRRWRSAGYTPATIIVDSPISFPDNQSTVWSPHNYDYTFWGPIPVRRAIEQSRNIPAIKTLQAVGIKTGIEYAQQARAHRRAAALPARSPSAPARPRLRR